LNTKRINKNISVRLKMPQATVAKVTGSIIDKISKELRTSKKPLRLAGLGRFKITTVRSHPGYDITTGGTREFPKSIRIHFKTDSRFKSILNNPIKDRQQKDKNDWLAARAPKNTDQAGTNVLVQTVVQVPAAQIPPKAAGAPSFEVPATLVQEAVPVQETKADTPMPEPSPLLDIPKPESVQVTVETQVIKTKPEPTLVDWENKKETSGTTDNNPRTETTEKGEPVMDTQGTPNKASGEVQQVIRETADYIQRRMLIIFGSVLAGLVLFFTLAMVLTFKSKNFYNFIRTRVMMVNEENKLTYEQIDALVAERMKEMQLDLSQTKDIFKNELTAMQDTSEKKIRGMIMSDVKSQLRKAPRSIHSTGKPLIRIIQYTVRKGDNLWRISELKSNNPYNWVGIYKTNGQKIKNPNLIYPGQVILIPIIINC
jgi:nucleoid-associated protein YgaU/nucleoid DNA-binding protein